MNFLSIALIAIVIGFPPFTSPPTKLADGKRELHLIVIEGHDCDGTDKDVANIKKLFEQMGAKHSNVRITLHEIKGKAPHVSKYGVYEKLSSLPTNTNDSVFLYFSGHGCSGLIANHHEHFLVLAKPRSQGNFLDGFVSRSEIIRILRSKNLQTCALVTDCCSTAFHSDTLGQLGFHLGPDDFKAADGIYRLLFENGTSGEVFDLTAATLPIIDAKMTPLQIDEASINSFSWGSKADGSLFTTVFLETLQKESKNWNSFQDALARHCVAKFQSFKTAALNEMTEGSPDFARLTRQKTMKPQFKRWDTLLQNKSTSIPATDDESRNVAQISKSLEIEPNSLPVMPVSFVAPNPAFQEGLQEKTVDNLFTGNGRIRKAKFHAIFLINSANNEIRVAGPRMLENLQIMINAFRNEITQEAEKAGLSNSRQIGSDLFSSQLVIEGSDFNWPEIQTKLSAHSSNIQEDDVIFIWIMTHGKLEGGTAKLLMNSTNIAGNYVDRSDVRDACRFAARRPRLAIFITDACRPEDSTGPFGRGAVNLSYMFRGTTIWKSLYFGHQGIVDINSSKDGQKSFLAGASVFGEAYMDTFNGLFKDTARKDYDLNSDDFIDWNTEYFPRLERDFLPAAYRRAMVRLKENVSPIAEEMEKQREQNSVLHEQPRPLIIR